MMLIFRKDATAQTVTLPSGTIPGHGGSGQLHVAFAIAKDELDRWEAHLASCGVIVEGRNHRKRNSVAGRTSHYRCLLVHCINVFRKSGCNLSSGLHDHIRWNCDQSCACVCHCAARGGRSRPECFSHAVSIPSSRVGQGVGSRGVKQSTLRV
jgi:hypothetical protein